MERSPVTSFPVDIYSHQHQTLAYLPPIPSTLPPWSGRNITSSAPQGSANYSDDQAAMEDSVRFQYLAWGVTGTTIAVLGLIGNVLSILVLSHRRMKSSTSSYLTALAVYDCLVLVSLVLFMALPSIYMETGHLRFYYSLFPYIQPFAYPLALISQTCSIYTTVGFTVERYIAVCLPLTAAKMCTISRARKSILIILLCSVVYNIPRMLEYTTISYVDPLTNQTEAIYTKTALGQSPTYRHVYFIVMHITVMLVVPFSLLMVLNALLIRAVKRSASVQGRITSKQRHENNLTVMLLSVVVVFLVCQVLSIVDNICSAVLPREVLYSPPLIKLTCISSLMVITNSATNFYLYCVFGHKFRHVFCTIFCSRLKAGWGDRQLTQVSGASNYQRPLASPRLSTPPRTPHGGHNNTAHGEVTENGSQKAGLLVQHAEKDRYTYKRLPVGSKKKKELAHKETVM